MKRKKEAGKRKIYLDDSRYDLIRYNWKSAGMALVLVLASLGALFALEGGSITGLTAKDLGECLAVDLTDGKEQIINIKDGALDSLTAGESTAKFKLMKNGKAYDFYLYPTDETLAKETIKSGETKQFYFGSTCGGEADLLVKITTKSLIGKAFGGKDQAVLKWLKAPVSAKEKPRAGVSVVPRAETPQGILIDLSDEELHIVNVSDEAKNVLIRIGPTDYRLVVDVTAENRANINIYREEEKVFGKNGASFKKAEYADLDADERNDLYIMINAGKNNGLVELQLRWDKPEEEATRGEEIVREEEIRLGEIIHEDGVFDLSETDQAAELDDAVGEIKFELGGKIYVLKVDVTGTSCLNNAMSIYLNDASNISNLIAMNNAVITIKQFDLDKDGVNDLKVEIKSCKDHGKINVVLSWLNKPVPMETIDLSNGEKQEIEIDDNGKVKIKIDENEYELQIDGSAELGAVEKICMTTKISVLAEGAEIASQSGSKMIKEFDLDKDGVNDLSVEITACEDKGKVKANIQWLKNAAAEEVTIKLSLPAETIPSQVGKEVSFSINAEQFGGELSSLLLDFKVDPSKVMGAEAVEVSSEPGKAVKEFHWLPKKTGVYSVEFIVQAEVGGVLYGEKSTVNIEVTGAKHQFLGYVINGKEGQNVFAQTQDLLFETPITLNKTYGKEKEFMVYGQNGTILMFSVNDMWILNYTLSDGQVTELNLTVPSTVTTASGETTQAAPSGSPSSGGSGGGGYGPSAEELVEAPAICYYQWSCTEWSSCFGGEQTRTCERTDDCAALLAANPSLTVISYPKDAESKKCAAVKKEAAPKAPAQPKITPETVAPELGAAEPTPEKKSSLGLILSLVAGALLLAAAGVLIWWKMKPKRPSAMAYPPLKR